MCRSGFITYEHIDPLFEDAKEHSAEKICCLCASHHDAVTGKRLSKEAVQAAYRSIQCADIADVQPPFGPIDFFNGHAELKIGGLSYYPAVHTILRFHGKDLIRVFPATRPGEIGEISALFTDDQGQDVLRLERNEWIGSLRYWDIDTSRARLVVRRKKGDVVLALRLEPPGRIVVEHLDMRYGNSHVLASEQTFATGIYLPSCTVAWMHAEVAIIGSDANGAAIEFSTSKSLGERIASVVGTIPTGIVHAIGGIGAVHLKHGICLGSGCSLALRNWAVGSRALSDMRRVLFSYPESVPEFIGTGRIS